MFLNLCLLFYYLHFPVNVTIAQYVISMRIQFVFEAKFVMWSVVPATALGVNIHGTSVVAFLGKNIVCRCSKTILKDKKKYQQI